MNRHCHRIVFNAARGQLMVVAETAQRCGKSASGESPSGTAGAHGPALLHPIRQTALAALVALGAMLTSAPVALAQIIADPAAPANQRPTVLSDSAGRPLVNIQTPSAAGLSRNTYRQFDVPTSGIVLNNVASNPWLANGVLAKTILNEVNSTSPSYLNGAITVNGGSAQVIVANPNGIQVNGGSFTNASRATLTTGTAQVSDGALNGFDVRGGTVTIGAGGLNNSATPYTDILSQAVSVAGTLTAQSVGITTGKQTVAYDTGLISNQDTAVATGAAAYAIDTGALGGMYANNISILATESGLGVRNQGTWQASGGQIVVTADGLLRNQGPVSANVASLATVSGDIENAGNIQGGQAVLLSSGRDVRLTGAGLTQTAGSAVVVSAKRSAILEQGCSSSGCNSAKVVSNASGGQVSVSAGQDVVMEICTAISASGNVQVAADGQFSSTYSTNIQSLIGDVTVLAGTGIRATATKFTGKVVHLETGKAFSDTTANIGIQYEGITASERATVLASGNLAMGQASVSSGGKVQIAGSTGTSLRETTLKGADIEVTGQNVSLYGTKVTSEAKNGLSGDVSIHSSNGLLTLSPSVGNCGATKSNSISAAGTVDITAIGGDLTLTGGTVNASNVNIASSDRVSLRAAWENNVFSGPKITAQNDLRVSSLSDGHMTLNGAKLTSTAGDISIVSKGYISQWGPYLQPINELTAENNILISGTGVQSVLKGIYYKTLPGPQYDVAYTKITAGKNLAVEVTGADLTLDSTVFDQIKVGRDMSFRVAGTLTFSGLDGSAGYGSSQRVSITTQGNLSLVADNINLYGSVLRANGGAIKLTATTGNLNVAANKVRQWSAGFNNTYWDQAQLVASNGIDARAAGDINLDGVYAHTWGQASFLSGGNLTTSGKVNRGQVDNRPSAGSSYNGWYQDEEWVRYSNLTGNQGLTLGAMGGHLRVSGTNLNGGSGTATLQALGDVRLEAAMTDKVHKASSWGWNETWWGKRTSWTTYHNRAWRDVNAVSVYARDISIKAGSNLETYATRLSATNNLKIEAGEQALYYAVKSETDHTDTSHSSTSWIGIGLGSSQDSSTTRISTPMVTYLYARDGNLTSYSGGDQLFQGTQATYLSRDVRAGVGDKAKADARIILEGVITSVQQSRTSKSDAVVWQSMSGSGSTTETLALPTFAGGGTFSAPGGLSVQIPDGDFKTQIATLSAQPGMGYLNDLTARTDVNWQPVKLAHDQWSYSQEGLTPAGAALLSVAVAWATGGMGASMLGTTGTATSAMANAAFTSLASQASITLINNKGDIGKTLKDMSSSSTVKATLAAVLTAGVLDKLGSTSTMEALRKSGGFSDKLTFNLINATGRALTNTAINGGNLEDTLKAALVGGLVDTAHGEAASVIKGLESQYLAHKLAHALAGCVAGAAAGGACKDGAIGAAVGEMVAQMFDGQTPGAGASKEQVVAHNQKVLAYSKLVAGAVSAYAGGNAQTAIATAEVAVQNNYLSKPQLTALQTELNACKHNNCTEAQTNAVLDKYVKLSASNDTALAACTTTACVDQHRNALLEASALSQEVKWQVSNLQANSQLVGELVGRESLNKASTVQYQYARAAHIEEARKQLDQYVQSQCQGLSSTACTTKLQSSQATANAITEIFVGFTPAGIAVDIKDLLEASTMQERSLAVLGVVLPGLGDGIKALSRANNALPIAEKTLAKNGLKIESNTKHTPGQQSSRPDAGIEPRNSLDLFNESIPDPRNPAVRWTVDESGGIHRFSGKGGDGTFHWSGSTTDARNPLRAEKKVIPQVFLDIAKMARKG